jgi:hypothetical protein
MSDRKAGKLRILALCAASAALLSASCDDRLEMGAGRGHDDYAGGGHHHERGGGHHHDHHTRWLQRGCVVTWRVDNAATIGALQFETLYGSAPGDFNGSDDFVECDDLTGSLASFNDDDVARKLTAGFINLAGFTTPRSVMTCNFCPVAGSVRDPVPADFTVNVIDATDPALTPVTADVTVSAVDCTGGGGISTTTPSSSVTTTSTTVTTNTVTTTTTTLGPGTFVAFSLVDPVTIGALQFSVDYSQAAGDFEGTGSLVSCSDHTGSLSSYNDVDASKQLNVGLISTAGFTGPRLVVTCAFLPGGAFDAADFAVTVIDATDPSLNAITPFPTIAVSVVNNAG